MRRRLDLAASLVGRPSVIFLDEPTTGLDPHSRQAMWDEVSQLVATGVAVLLTTQYLEEADVLADRIAVLDGGRVVAEGTAAELKRRVAEQRLELVLADATAFAAVERALGPRVLRRDRGARRLALATDGTAAHVRALLDEVDPGGRAVERFSVRGATLDDVFLALTGRAPAAETDPATREPARVDALTMSGRSIRLSMRHVDAMLTALLLPVMLMLLFVELFGGAIETARPRMSPTSCPA